jgi:hypothetical protein
VVRSHEAPKRGGVRAVAYPLESALDVNGRQRGRLSPGLGPGGGECGGDIGRAHRDLGLAGLERREGLGGGGVGSG